jgi:hypothetical protein
MNRGKGAPSVCPLTRLTFPFSMYDTNLEWNGYGVAWRGGVGCLES